MQKPFALVALVLTISLSACSYVKFPSVYKLDIQQGNILEEEQVQQLKIGMTERQVRYVLGTPIIEDTFNPGRWDYYYSLKNGKDDSVTTKRVTAFFTDGRLTEIVHHEPTKTTP